MMIREYYEEDLQIYGISYCLILYIYIYKMAAYLVERFKAIHIYLQK